VSYVPSNTRPTELAAGVEGYALLDTTGGARPVATLELQLLGRNLLDEAHLVSADSRAVLPPASPEY